ncbi:hypothetical protein K431DRAFT_227262 [Polychaeton citri CBS 116435]|uniref:Vacuolar segregation subunit 7-domain-containing protein n=1 Tax=Polychaeton citri CBS 116435 TaxID=1314669 RepID=A0A9P4UMX6_9PEZI|nr:hypothetical protein K431DRAFT_227262 [Polychaeton citri CBS 116435]
MPPTDAALHDVKGANTVSNPTPTDDQAHARKGDSMDKADSLSSETNAGTNPTRQSMAQQPQQLPFIPKKTLSNSSTPLLSRSATSSPIMSRNTSPQRKDSSRQNAMPGNISTQPSAAAIQRALSATNITTLPHAAADNATKQRGNRSAETSGNTTPQWPISPRLKSPPPSTGTTTTTTTTTTPRRLSMTGTSKKADGNIPSVVLENSSPAVQSPQARQNFPTDAQSKPESSSQQQQHTPTHIRQPPTQQGKPPIRGPSNRSTLETVQETSSDSIPEPPAATRASADLRSSTRLSDDDTASVATDGANEDRSKTVESGSESGGNRGEKKQRQGSTATLTSKSGYPPLVPSKSRKTEGVRNMTVETETVPSIPQSGLNAGDRSSTRGDASGSIRLKPSNETIRPKKDRKRATNKSRSLNQGTGTPLANRSPLLLQRPSCESIDGIASSTASVSDEADSVYESEKSGRTFSLSQHAQRFYSTLRPKRFDYSRAQQSDNYPRKASSKADIFEARVASAVDEANSSDSDETFVYESNPPETQRRPRHHSRTPSVASSHSVADHQRGAMRSFTSDAEERRIAGKRSMKFSRNAYNDAESPTNETGTVRSHFPRHFGKHGRANQVSLHDPDSPFTQASRTKANNFGARHSRPGSPRSSHSMQQQQQRQGGLTSRKMEPSFDFDGNGADDERTPLIGSVRTSRSARYGRRFRQMPDDEDEIHPYYGVRRHSRCGGKWGGCILGGLVFAIVVLSAVTFLITSNRPMYDVRIRKIENVLASEQELMLDLFVGAVNPNPLAITVMDMDLNIFAKSKYLDTLQPPTGVSSQGARQRRSSDDRRGDPNGWQDLTGHWHSPGNVDDGTDPISGGDDEDLEGDAQTMLLGRIFHFDQPLAFEGSPVKRHTHSSLGELRLPKPGNKTETRGSERWEKVLEHPFELILRGVLKYQLPISSRPQTAAVGASVLVHPEDGVDTAGNMRLEKVSHREHWQWIDWQEIADGDSDEDLHRGNDLNYDEEATVIIYS